MWSWSRAVVEHAEAASFTAWRYPPHQYGTHNCLPDCNSARLSTPRRGRRVRIRNIWRRLLRHGRCEVHNDERVDVDEFGPAA